MIYYFSYRFLLNYLHTYLVAPHSKSVQPKVLDFAISERRKVEVGPQSMRIERRANESKLLCYKFSSSFFWGFWACERVCA